MTNAPRLDPASLAAFDPSLIDADFDDDEPLPLESLQITQTDAALLAGVSVTAKRCLFIDCDLSLLRLQGVKDSDFRGTKLRGTVFGKYLRNVDFERCALVECTLRMMVIASVNFANSQLQRCDFYDSELTDVAFAGSSIEGVGFDRCKLERVDLTQASDLLIGDPRTLAGASLRETQIPLIATRLAELSGIDVQA